MKTSGKIILPNEFLYREVLDSIRKGKSVTIPVKGGSMRPFLREGDKVVLEPYSLGDLKKGLVVFARTEEKMFLHRIVNHTKEFVYLAGDGNLVQHERVVHKEVLAKVAFVKRSDKLVKWNQKWRRALGMVWYAARPLRRIVKKLS